MTATLLLLIVTSTGSPAVFIVPSVVTSTASFQDNLADELAPGRLVSTATAATHRVRVDTDASGLLVAVERDGQLVLARTIPNDDPVAARRVALLLIVRAVRSRPAPTVEVRARPPPPTPTPVEVLPVEPRPAFTVAPQLLAVGWARPRVVPQVGLQVDIAYLEEGLGGGLSLAVAGGVCCSRSTANIEGSAVELHALLEGRVPLTTIGTVRVGFDAGVGVTGYFMTVRPVFDDSPSQGTEVLERDVELVLRGGVSGRLPLDDRWALVGRLAIRASIVGQQVLRPEAVGTEEPFGPGRLGPWVSAGVEWTLF